MDIQTPIPTECCQNDRCFKTAAIVIGILIIIGLFGNIYLLLQKQKLPEQSKILPTPTTAQVIITPTSVVPTSTIDETADWKTYKNEKLGFKLKYPDNYSLLKESPDIVLGFGNRGELPFPYLIISTTLSDYSIFKECTPNGSVPCLNATSGNQSRGIVDTYLDGKEAKSIYLTEGADGDYHIIQITNPIKLQLKMYIAGGGLGQTFDQILSTFRFD